MSDIGIGYFDDGSDNNLATRFAAVAGAGGNAAVQALGQGRTVQTLADYLKHKNIANVRDFGADNTGATDSSAAIQAALDTGGPVEFPDGDYKAVGLTQDTDFQRLFSRGRARIIKSGNGVILASTGNGVQCENLDFRGESNAPAFTGDNITFTGNDCTLLNCASRWAYGRAVKATGSHFAIKGTRDIYQTADATATGYDIEIGVSGTATLYHELEGVRSSQATGGILLIDTGSHTIKGGQFGKLYIKAGTKPGGVNGGKTIGARILGNVTVEQSSALFTSNQFGAVAVTLATNTSGCSLDASNVYELGATVTNNGNANNLIVRQVSTGGTVQLKIGDDSSLAVLTINTVSGQVSFPKAVTVENSTNLYFKDAAGALNALLQMSASNNLSISNFAGGVIINAKAAQRIQLTQNSVEKLAVREDGALRLGGETGPVVVLGAGSPEGVVSAVVGALYLRTDGAAGATLYIKQVGAGTNTGWSPASTSGLSAADATDLTDGGTTTLHGHTAAKISGGTFGAGDFVFGASSNLGFYGVTAASRPAALTQTYSTADRTLSAYTADAESTAYTGATDGEAKLADLNALRVAYENLRAFVEDLAQHHNALVDDLQALGLEQ